MREIMIFEHLFKQNFEKNVAILMSKGERLNRKQGYLTCLTLNVSMAVKCTVHKNFNIQH